MQKLRVAALFAGIGGIEKGLHETGRFETVLFSEIDPQASAVLGDKFDGVPNQGDITGLDLPSERIDVVTAGFPCQDLSLAGRTEGIEGSRSRLVEHVFALLDEREVEWVLIENVPFMLQLDRGKAMEYLVGRLEDLKFDWAYRVLDSRAFGLPQRRRRVFLLASRNRDPNAVLYCEDTGQAIGDDLEFEEAGTAFGFYSTEGTRGLGWAIDAVPTLKGGSGIGIPSPPAVWLKERDRIVTPDIGAAEMLQGFPEGWTSAAIEAGRESGRWKLVGNAVSVPVARWIGERMLTDTESIEQGRQVRPLGENDRWPAAAFGGPERGRHSIGVSEWPIRVSRRSLEEILEGRSQPLSARAAEGFLGRYVSGGLRQRQALIDALERHIERMTEDESALMARR